MIRYDTSKKRLFYLIIFIISISVFTLGLSFYTSYKIRSFFVDNSKKLLDNNIFLLKETVDQFYSQTMENVMANFALFRSNIYANGSFSLSSTETTRQKALNQISRLESEVDLPVMMYGGKPVLENFELVDGIVDKVGIEGLTTTIFQVINNGILRITTNVRTAYGDRAVGTYIPYESSVYRTVMRGGIYRGRAYVVNQWYWTIYEPIFAHGKVIGVLYMGIKESVLLSVLKKTFSSVSLGLSGYPFLMDDKGNLIIHPFDEGDNLKNTVTSDGKILFDIMHNNRSGWVKYKYPKPNGDMAEYKKLTRYMTVNALGWVVGAGVYEDEFYTDFAQYEIVYGIVIVLIMLLTGSVVAVNIFNTNRKLVEQSIELERLAVDAENANLAKSAFLANMSHEIRTPLNSIMGFSDLLSASDIPPKQKEFADTISQSAATLLNIINDILDISKIESGRVDLINESFDLQYMLDNVVKMFSVKAKEKDIKFYYVFDSDLPVYVSGDSVRIQQVLINLLGNAVKFTEAGGTVRLSLKNVGHIGEYIRIRFEVSDNGIGIRENALREIFEPFNQVDSSINRRYGGTGLGLAISNKLVEMMGGKLNVESTVNVGTVFSFDLAVEPAKHNAMHEKELKDLRVCLVSKPEKTNEAAGMVQSYLKNLGNVSYYEEDINQRCDIVFGFSPDDIHTYYSNEERKNYDAPVVLLGDDHHLDEETAGLVDYLLDHPIYLSKVYNTIITACGITGLCAVGDEQEQRYKGSVLVAEDNLTNQLLMKILLNHLGVEAVFVQDGQKAVEYCMHRTPDLVLMDINMPVMDGITAYYEITKNSEAAGIDPIPVVALTANAVKGDREKYMETGMADYLSKPIDKAELHRVLGEYLVMEGAVAAEESFIAGSADISELRFDKAASMKSVGIPEEDYDMILYQLFKTLEQDIEKLEKALKHQDDKAIYATLHYLKGAAVNMHLAPVSALLEEYTTRAKAGETTGYDIERLKAHFAEIRKTINT